MRDEFLFDPSLEEPLKGEEDVILSTAEESFAGEDSVPLPFMERIPEFEAAAAAPETKAESDGQRSSFLRKLMLLPLASSIAAVSIVFASFGADPLGKNFLTALSYVSSSAAPSTSAPSVTSPASTAPASTLPAATTESYTDSFPTLPNLDPDFTGAYAWNGMGYSEEYLVVDSVYLHAGNYYTDYASVPIATLSGASYDKSANTLTLNNYHGAFIDANLMGNGFKIRLEGDNSLDYIRMWGAMYGGSVTFTGSGTIKLNESKNYDSGLYIEGERSPSCVMIDREATVEVFGEHAIIVNSTTLEKAIYVLKPVEITGGECKSGEFVEYTVTVTDENGNVVFGEDGKSLTKKVTVKDISESVGMDLFDYSVVGADGLPSDHVIFKP